MERERQLPVRQRHILAWCAPCLPVSALTLPLVVFLPPHYSGTLGLPLATVGFVFAIIRVIDIPLDPLLGALMDLSRSRIGQFRPWLLAGALVMAAGVWLVFMAPPGISTSYAILSLLLLYLGWSMIYLAQTAWGSRLSPDYAGHTRIFGWWTATNSLAMLLVLLVPPIISWLAGQDSSTLIVHAMGWLVLALIPLCVLAAVLFVPEGETDASAGRIHLAGVVQLLHDRRMALLLACDLLLAIVPGITGALFLFFFTGVRGFSAATASALLVGYFLAGLLAAPGWVKGAHRFGKHRMVAVAGLWMGVVQLLVWVIPADAMVATAVAFVLGGVPIAAPGFLMRAMLSDLRDAQRLEGRDAGAEPGDTTGLSFAILTATGKLGTAIPVGLTYPLLALVGFDPAPGAANDATATAGLTLLFVLAPLALGAIGAAVVWRWPITAQVHAAVRARLDALPEAAPAAAAAANSPGVIAIARPSL